MGENRGGGENKMKRKEGFKKELETGKERKRDVCGSVGVMKESLSDNK